MAASLSPFLSHRIRESCFAFRDRERGVGDGDGTKSGNISQHQLPSINYPAPITQHQLPSINTQHQLPSTNYPASHTQRQLPSMNYPGLLVTHRHPSATNSHHPQSNQETSKPSPYINPTAAATTTTIITTTLPKSPSRKTSQKGQWQAYRGWQDHPFPH
jgi:hypothetical protein